MKTHSRVRYQLAALVGIAGAAAVSLAAIAGPVGAQTTTTSAAQAQGPGPGQRGAGRGGPNRAFCRQVTDSQAVIAAAKGDAVAKLGLTAAEWVKIEAQAPAAVKSNVRVVRMAFQAAAKARTNSAVKAPNVVTAGKAITTFVSANCNNGPGGGGGGGANGAALAEYRTCLETQGVTLPTPGAGQPLDQNDPKVAAAMKACQDKLPAGARGLGGGGGGGFGGGFAAIQDCLAKKKITIPRAQGRQGGGGAPLDAKTQKAIADCRAEAARAATTTIKK